MHKAPGTPAIPNSHAGTEHNGGPAWGQPLGRSTPHLTGGVADDEKIPRGRGRRGTQCVKRLPGLSWHVSRDTRILSSRCAVSALRSFEAVSALQRKSLTRMHAVSRLTSHGYWHASFTTTFSLPFHAQAKPAAVDRGPGGRVVSTPGTRLSQQPGIGSPEGHSRQCLHEVLQHSVRGRNRSPQPHQATPHTLTSPPGIQDTSTRLTVSISRDTYA